MLIFKFINTCCQNSINPVDLFRNSNELLLSCYKHKHTLAALGDNNNSLASLVPWSLLTKISNDEGQIVTSAEFEAILRMTYNVHTLKLGDDNGILLRAILHNRHNLGIRVHQQIQSLEMDSENLTWNRVRRFRTSLSKRLPNLKHVSFCIYYEQHRRSSNRVDYRNKSTKHIVNLIASLVDRLKQLVTLDISFVSDEHCNERCFPHLNRQQLHQHPLS
ncbi:unnamed protein product [Rotaria magnacalcarata]